MRAPLILGVLFALLLSIPAHAKNKAKPASEGRPVAAQGTDPQQAAPLRKKRGPVHRIVLYVPNRVLDVLDFVRLRLRIGPGIGLGVRATENVDLYAGAYLSGYAGLPGPRNRKAPRMPLGIESKVGVEVSRADLTTSFGIFDPNYSESEFGVDVHVAVIGVSAGVDPVEFVDLLAGFIFLDPKEDDL